MNGEAAQEVSTIILGVGNLLRKDDGIGIHILNRLEDMDLPEGVRLLDGGTAGLDVVPYLENVRRLIIIDALFADGAPGEVRILPEGQVPGKSNPFYGHHGSIQDIIDTVAALWERPHTTVVGVIPADCASYEIGLSPELHGSVDRAADLIAKMIYGA